MPTKLRPRKLLTAIYSRLITLQMYSFPASEYIYIYYFLLQVLLYICGSKEKYRQLRDLHALEAHMKEVRSLCGGNPDDHAANIILPYDVLITLVCNIRLMSHFKMHPILFWVRKCN